MNGLVAMELLIGNLAQDGIETNVVLVALKVQNKHLHPIPNSLYKVKINSWIKLVV